MARTTVREHLLHLKEKDLLSRTSEPQGRGRPSHRYEMTRRAKVLFPSRDGELLGRLVEYLQEHGEGDMVKSFFEDYWENRTKAVKQKLREMASDDVDDKVETLREILEEEGFMPDINHEENRVTIRECNCPFPEAVKETRLPCQLEEEFYKTIFETELERVSHIPEGSSSCTYEVEIEHAGR